MSNKTLYIHIGHFKTGTTALQIFLNKNADRLAQKNDIRYLQSNCHHSKHSAFAFSILQDAGVKKLMHGYKNQESSLEMWSTLFEDIRTSDCATTVISSEEFIRIGAFRAAEQKLLEIAQLGTDISIKPIVYLRSPQEHLKSWYNQIVKMGFAISDYDSALLEDIESVHYDYAQALNAWGEAFGPENLIVREYFGNRKNNTYIFEDFLSIISGDSSLENFDYPTEDPNPSQDSRTIELVRLIQNTGQPKQTMQNIRRHSEEYFAKQDRLKAIAPKSINTIRKESRAGVNWLAQLTQVDMDLKRFEENLPSIPSQDGLKQTNLMLGFILSELISLRKRVNKLQNNAD